jgi:hypothetical protein
MSLITQAEDVNSKLLKSLNANELSIIDNDSQVFKTKAVKDAVWPRITIYQKIAATPLEAIALFLALDNQKNYVPNLIVSDPVKHISAVEVHTKYVMDMPWPIPDSDYIHGSVLEKTCKNCYGAYWYLVKSNSAEEVSGRVDFIPYKSGSLMRYESFIVPSSVFASFVKASMFKDVKHTLSSIKEHIEIVSPKKESPLLKKYIPFIHESLKGVNVYQNIIKSNLKK